MRKNCWEFMRCGREPGGKNVEKLGVCPASTAKEYDGVNGGKNGGRCCCSVVGTDCEGKIQGTFIDKVKGCIECDFYRYVFEQEKNRDFT